MIELRITKKLAAVTRICLSNSFAQRDKPMVAPTEQWVFLSVRKRQYSDLYKGQRLRCSGHEIRSNASCHLVSVFWEREDGRKSVRWSTKM